MSSLHDEFRQHLQRFQRRFDGDPRRELEQLLLFALEREQLVSVAYRTELMQLRLSELHLHPDVRAIAAQALAWAWKDEQMHTVYTRGQLVRLGGLSVRWQARAHQWAGAVAGWASSVKQHLGWRRAPVSQALASLVTLAGRVLGKVPKALRNEIALMPFQRFCELQVEAEETASACWQRIAELGSECEFISEETAGEFRRTWQDEEAHRRVFAILASMFVAGHDPAAADLAARVRDVSEFFLPRSHRSGALGRNPLGSGGKVWVVEGRQDHDKCQMLRDLLRRSGLEQAIAERSAAAGKPVSELTVVIKPSFMLGYDRRDLSMVTDPRLVELVAGFLREMGCANVIVAEAPTLYGGWFENRSVPEVGRYFGFDSPDFELADMGDDQVEHQYHRGMGQNQISRTWRDADFRISFAKMRSHPIDLTHLTIAGLQGIASGFEESLFPGREAHRDTVLLAPLSEFPPHFGLIDGYDSAADGIMGVLACPRPPQPRRFYAGADALAVDMVATRHLGTEDARDSLILDSACHWFGDPTPVTEVVGVDEAIPDWRPAVHNGYTAMLSLLAWPVWQWGSRRGALFVPHMDEEAFPPTGRSGLYLRCVRGLVRFMTGMRAPR